MNILVVHVLEIANRKILISLSVPFLEGSMPLPNRSTIVVSIERFLSQLSPFLCMISIVSKSSISLGWNNYSQTSYLIMLRCQHSDLKHSTTLQNFLTYVSRFIIVVLNLEDIMVLMVF